MLVIGGIGPYLLMWAFVFGIIAVCGRVCFGKDQDESLEAVFGEDFEDGGGREFPYLLDGIGGLLDGYITKR